jgi:hypothetical protein
MTDRTPAELLAMQVKTLMLIEAHLKSIRSSVTFFVVLVVLGIIFQLIIGFFSILGM